MKADKASASNPCSGSVAIRTPIRRRSCTGCLVSRVALALALPVVTAFAATSPAPPASDKSRFNLFRPTPAELMREMAADRPDKTESPYTVDAGHFQIEMDLFNYTHDHDTTGSTDTRADSYSVAPVNLKAGLLNDVDFQVIFETFTHERVADHVAGTTSIQSGFGDLTTRLKVNLWGNDGGDTALAVMPFVTLPTHQHTLGNDGVEGGVIFPLAIALPRKWSVGLMTEFDFNRDSARGGKHAEFINTITFGHPILGRLDGYVEFFSLVSAEKDSDWIGTVDVGFTYAVTENLQLDAGVNLGVTSAADDVNPFAGLSVRF